MLLRLAGKLAWGTTKLTVRYVVVPIAITAATAIVMDEISERLRGERAAPQKQAHLPVNGVEPVISPER